MVEEGLKVWAEVGRGHVVGVCVDFIAAKVEEGVVV